MRIEIDSTAFGKVHFNAADADWNLVDGEGWRVYRKNVLFKGPFSKPPEVSVAFSALDILQGANTRIFCRTSNVTNEGFELEVGTWYDTHVWGATVSWIVFGE